MKALDPEHEARIAELRTRLEQLDAERNAVAAKIHRLADPQALQGPPPGVKKEPLARAKGKDWHVFAGPAKQRTKRSKSR